jgi:hypothetical protein
MALFDPEISFSPVFARATGGPVPTPGVDFGSISLTKPEALPKRLPGNNSAARQFSVGMLGKFEFYIAP